MYRVLKGQVYRKCKKSWHELREWMFFFNYSNFVLEKVTTVSE